MSGWDKEEKLAIDNPRVNYLGDLDQQQLALAFAGALGVIVPDID